MKIIQSFLTGQWIGETQNTLLKSAINGDLIGATHAEVPDFNKAAQYARKQGQQALMQMDFQQRATCLRNLAKYLLEHKESLYSLSRETGATRNDSWIDIEGGFGTLFAYASMGRNQLPSGNLIHADSAMPLGKNNDFAGTHILVPKGGVAVHINAFNFPIWGMLEKFAPCFLAGMPCMVKPASATSYLTEATVRLMHESGLLPEGSLQLIIGSTGDLLDHLIEQDVVTFTGSAHTARLLKNHENLVNRSIPFNAEADSLNAAILAPDVSLDDAEIDLFVREVFKEMTTKVGQKCTAIRRIIVPRDIMPQLIDKLSQKLAKVTYGDPDAKEVRMGALASIDQLEDVKAKIAELSQNCELVYSQATNAKGIGCEKGAFIAPHLFVNHQPLTHCAAHDVEAFGPVATMMPYDSIEEALAIAALGKGSLVTTLCTKDPMIAAKMIPSLAALHGRLHILDAQAALESTGHGSPLPFLKHGGPGRAGGGEELAGISAVHHYMQKAAIQGSPTMLSAVTGEYVRGAEVIETDIHPFKRSFESVRIGESLLTHRRTVTEADIVNFGSLSGDHFYMHFDDIAAKESQFGERIAHGYFVLSAAAGLFVDPGVGPVLANYGLDNLRFIEPVPIGTTIRARLTCKRKIDQGKESKDGKPQGVVVWDVQVTDQEDVLVASYDILTLVAKDMVSTH